MAKQKSVGAPLNNKCPEFSMILEPNGIIHTGSVSSQHTWHTGQSALVEQKVCKKLTAP